MPHTNRHTLSHPTLYLHKVGKVIFKNTHTQLDQLCYVDIDIYISIYTNQTYLNSTFYHQLFIINPKIYITKCKQIVIY